MDKIKLLNRINELYKLNVNIIEYLKKLEQKNYNLLEDIMISYDFQAGSYCEKYKEDSYIKNEYCLKLANVIEELGVFESLVEVGIGEATTLGPMLKRLKNKPAKCYGFDISWSRIKYAIKFLEEINLNNIELFTGDLFCSPLKTNSIDIVYTSHSIEPNGGREKEALEELYRITNKYLILLEPSYELASEEARQRMKKQGYITNLYNTAKELGYNIIRYELFGISMNNLNPTGLMIIKKETNDKISNPICCPITKSDLIFKNNAYFSEESLLAYPVIKDIPCLLSQNAIIATKFLD